METKVRMINRVTGVPMDVQGSESGDAFVQYGAAKYEEITRDGYAFSVVNSTATVPIIAAPSTTVLLGLYNSSADGGKSIIIDALYGYCTVVTAALGQASLMYVLGQTRVTALTLDLTIRKANGMGPTTDSVCLAEDAGTILDGITGVALGYQVIGDTAHHRVASEIGASLWAAVDGRIIIPPGRAFGLTVLSSVASTARWIVGAAWHEKQIKLY